MSTYSIDTSPLQKWRNVKEQRKAEELAAAQANAKAHTFDPGALAGGALTLLTGGGAAPLFLSALGEGARAATGSNLDLGSMASLAGDKFLPELTPSMIRNPAITTPGIGLQNAATPAMAKALPTVASEPSMMDRFMGYINPANASTWTQPVTAKERANMETYNKLLDTGAYREVPKVSEVGNMSLQKMPIKGAERPGYTQYQDPNTGKYSYVRDVANKISLDNAALATVSDFNNRIKGRSLTYDQAKREINNSTILTREMKDLAISKLRNVSPYKPSTKTVKTRER